LENDVGAFRDELDENLMGIAEEQIKTWRRLLAIEKHLNIQRPEWTNPIFSDEELEMFDRYYE
jgi:hypothetical protein